MKNIIIFTDYNHISINYNRNIIKTNVIHDNIGNNNDNDGKIVIINGHKQRNKNDVSLIEQCPFIFQIIQTLKLFNKIYYNLNDENNDKFYTSVLSECLII